MNSPWIEAYPEYPKHRQSENLLSISHLLILIYIKKIIEPENREIVMGMECVNEPSQSKRKASMESRRHPVF